MQITRSLPFCWQFRGKSLRCCSCAPTPRVRPRCLWRCLNCAPSRDGRAGSVLPSWGLLGAERRLCPTLRCAKRAAIEDPRGTRVATPRKDPQTITKWIQNTEVPERNTSEILVHNFGHREQNYPPLSWAVDDTISAKSTLKYDLI